MVNESHIIRAMIDYNHGDPKRIQHFMKVHGFASVICSGENLDPEVVEIIGIAAIVHDIGIRISEKKYNSASGQYQEIEGPAEARTLLSDLGVEESIIERCCWLIAHHHTYSNIQDIDHQILVEADFLVNIYEEGLSRQSIESVRGKIFKTATGTALLNSMYMD